MGLFDFLKKKNNDHKKEESDNKNKLETLLEKAAVDPAYRVDFYKHLLTEELVVITINSNIPQGVRILEENIKVNLATLKDGRIPVFTSTSKIFEKGVIRNEVQFLAMKGRNLFDLAKNATFILNPYSDYGKELLPNEIESLLNGTILTDDHKQIIVQKDTQVQIGQPANYPFEMVKALNTLFAKRPTVKAAYLGWIFNPSSDEPPHLIFALDIDGEKQSITNETGFTVKQFLKQNEIVDFMQIDKTGGISDYFINETKPFYVKQ